MMVVNGALGSCVVFLGSRRTTGRSCCRARHGGDKGAGWTCGDRDSNFDRAGSRLASWKGASAERRERQNNGRRSTEGKDADTARVKSQRGNDMDLVPGERGESKNESGKANLGRDAFEERLRFPVGSGVPFAVSITQRHRSGGQNASSQYPGPDLHPMPGNKPWRHGCVAALRNRQ